MGHDYFPNAAVGTSSHTGGAASATVSRWLGAPLPTDHPVITQVCFPCWLQGWVGPAGLFYYLLARMSLTFLYFVCMYGSQ